MKLPDEPTFLINQLIRAGYDAYVVGGCVRDTLLGITPNDWDICTAARPEEIKQVFPGFKTIDIGMRHGTVAVILDNQPYEITTFRTDGSYHDNRRPESVCFVPNVEEDLRRRDFTVNAMAYNEKNGLVDICGGREDLKQGVLRTVGEADIRFGEDALRIMRCLRFAATYSFHIEEATAISVMKNKTLLGNIAVERLNSEFSKLLCGKGAEPVLKKYKAVLSVFLPELLNTNRQAYESGVALAVKTPAPLPARLAAFFSSLPEEMLPAVLYRLKYSNQMINDTIAYRRFTHPLPNNRIDLKHLLAEIGFDGFDKMLLLKELAGENISFARSVAHQARQNRDCMEIKDLAVKGSDLKEMGYCGKEIGSTLNALLDKVISEKVENSYEALLQCLDKKGNNLS